MKFNKKIVMPMLAIAAVSAMGIGATYALFTSSANTDIQISAGNVKVNMVLENLKTFSGTDLKGDGTDPEPTATAVNGKFTNGGSAAISGQRLTLSKMTPGDKVTFDLKITNLSNVSIKYRTIVSLFEDSGLFAGLVVKINNVTYNGITSIQPWATMAGSDSEQTITTLAISAELPATAGSEYMNKGCELEFVIEALQGNAHTEDPEPGVVSIYSKNDLLAWGRAMNNSAAPIATSFKLANDIDLENADWAPICGYGDFTLDGNNHTIYHVNGIQTTEPNPDNQFVSGLIGYWPGASIKNLTISDSAFEGTNKVGAFAGNGTCVELLNCHTVNTTLKANINVVTDHYDNGDKVGGLVGYLCADGTNAVASVENCTVTNITVEGYRDCGGLVGYMNETASSVGAKAENCTVNGIKLINNRINGYKPYTTDAEYDMNFVIGEQTTGTEVINCTSIGSEDFKIKLADGFSINKAGEYEISNASGMVTFGSYVDSKTNLFEGKTIKLTQDINLTGIEWNPIGEVGYATVEDNKAVFCGTFDGCGYTISNLKTTDQKSAGLFASLAGVIKNLVIDGAEVNSNHYAGAVVGWIDSSPSTKIENVTVKNSKVTTKAELIGDEWNNGDKAGGIVGYTGSGPSILNCIVEDTNITGYRDIGGLIGYVSTGIVTGNTVKNCNIYNDRSHNYQRYTADAQFDCNKLVGELMSGTVENNNIENVVVSVL